MGLACMFMSCRQHGHGVRPAHHGHPHSQHRQPLQLQRHKQQEGVDHTLAGTGVALECAAHTDIPCCASLGWCAVCGCSLAQQEAYQQQVSCSVFPQLQLLRVITMQSCPCCRLGPDHVSACLLKSLRHDSLTFLCLDVQLRGSSSRCCVCRCLCPVSAVVVGWCWSGC